MVPGLVMSWSTPWVWQYTGIVSRAFVNEDAAGDVPERYTLPDRSDPGFNRAAARALLRGADQGDTAAAEAATGFYWGDPALQGEVERIRAEAQEDGDERLEQLAERFLRRAARGAKLD
jgi:hypothetical protein